MKRSTKQEQGKAQELFQVGDQVVYRRGAREVLYGKTGTIVYSGENDGLIQVVFEGGRVYSCLPSNLDKVPK